MENKHKKNRITSAIAKISLVNFQTEKQADKIDNCDGTDKGHCHHC